MIMYSCTSVSEDGQEKYIHTNLIFYNGLCLFLNNLIYGIPGR